MNSEKKYQVVLQTAFLGDLFLSIPLFLEIKKKFPQDALVLICKKGQGSYFLQKGLVDYVFEVIKGDRSSYQSIIHELNSLNVDHLFCVHRSVRSQLMSWQIKASHKIGFKSLLGRFIFHDLVPYMKAWPDAIRQLMILKPLQVETVRKIEAQDWSYLNKPYASGKLPDLPDFLSAVSSTLLNSKKVALFPGSVWATKKWTLEGFTEVAQEFLNLGYEVYLMGGPDEKNLCQTIQEKVPAAVVLAGQLKIPESMEFISKCRIVISNDSAPTHMAASQNIPVVTIFGPTTLDLGFRPWSSKSVIVERTDLGCRPCGKHGHQKCPLGHHNCMKFISSQDVMKAATDLIRATSP